MGKGLASAIETGESAVDKTTEVMGKTKKQASEASSVAGQKTNQACSSSKAESRIFSNLSVGCC